EIASRIVRLLKVQRTLWDSLSAAYEYLAFHEEVPEKELAKRLSSEFVPEKTLLKHFEGLDSQRSERCNLGATPYHVGMNLIQEAYDAGMKVIDGMASNSAVSSEEQEGKKRYLRAVLLRTLYSGLRPARITATAALLALESEKEKEASTGHSFPIGEKGFRA
ncbi:MAG: hypothetical protein AAB356_02400, partial [Deltaproteobacteria bacterium]